MEKKISKTEALNKPLVSSTATRRQELATEAMKLFLANQGRYRKMTPLSRLKYWLGGKGWCSDWKADFEYNLQDIAKKSFILADEMLKAETE
jgi:hypothetical protein